MTSPERIAKGLYWDRAWSLVRGCTKVSEGCRHCWAERESHMRTFNPNEKVKAQYSGLTDGDGRFNGQIRLMENNLDLPLKVKSTKVWAVWNDLLHEDVPDEFIKKFLFRVWYYKQHVFLVLTKRPERIAGKGRCSNCGSLAPIEDNAECPNCGTTEKYMRERGFGTRKRDLPKNLWLGVTAENQEQANKRIPLLLQVPAAVHWVSCEPLIGPVNIELYLRESGLRAPHWLDWCVAGGESGPGARPMHPDWARSLRDQCQTAGTPFFFKQHGEWTNPAIAGVSGDIRDLPINQYQFNDGIWVWKYGKKKAGRLLDGRTWDEFPEVVTAHE